MPLLECNSLTLGYDNTKILKDLSFQVNKGDYLCIVGENGSGKSTLIKTILGILKPIEGNVVFNDGLKATEIGYLPQQTEVQRDFPASVREVVLSGCLNQCGMRPFYSKTEKLLAADNMEKLNISAISKKCYRELSGGQQQRVLLARALCATQKLLLLDEPVSGLDPAASAEMYNTINRLNSDESITVIMISHDIASAVKYASHILHIGDYRALFYGKKSDYQKSGVGRVFTARNEAVL